MWLEFNSKEIKKYKTEIIPVDSEHFSIWALLEKFKLKKTLKLKIY